MKKLIVLACSLFWAQLIFGQVQFNPQFGITASRLSSDPSFAMNPSARPGFTAGFNLRIGDRLYVQPGVFWTQSGASLESEETIGEIDVKDDLNLHSIKVPLLLGFKLVNTDPFKLRLGAGGVANFITNVKENQFGQDKEDFTSPAFGVRAGLGVDIFFFTLDIDYEWGISPYFKDESSKQQQASVALGVVF